VEQIACYGGNTGCSGCIGCSGAEKKCGTTHRLSLPVFYAKRNSRNIAGDLVVKRGWKSGCSRLKPDTTLQCRVLRSKRQPLLAETLRLPATEIHSEAPDRIPICGASCR